ncbi:MAG: hypothetical protein H0T82_12355 [Sphingomonas sp.]|nr:hypothetical protein [Sphingomonas sp.]
MSPSTLIGIVGFTPVLDCYPLGPKLLAALETGLTGHDDVAIENMSWGPIHIVQRFQDEGAARPRRLVLVGGAAVSLRPGQVRAFRWLGGSLPAQAVQERIYEAVTGIVDIENTLVIGTHFSVWPEETYSVELDLAADTFGRLVIADNQGSADDRALAGELGFSPEAAIAKLAETTVALALDRSEASVVVEGKSALDCAKVESFARNRIAVTA